MTDPIEQFRAQVTTLRTSSVTGQSWTLAQAIAHCAQSVECSLAGYPKLRSGLFRATVGPLVKRKFIRAGRMSHDVTAAISGATAIPPTVVLADACDRATAALAAFTAFDGELAPHLAYGRCTKSEYAQLHWLHFADHLRSFGLP